MSRPLIGITASLHQELPLRDWIISPHDYLRAVERAGGIAVLLPFVESEELATAVLDRIDGLLLAGGEDLDPMLYGELPHPGTGLIVPERDQSELAYARTALARKLPLLGICRGVQVLAVAAGGTLWQDIPSQVAGAIKHKAELPKWYPTHPVSVEPGSRLAALLGTQLTVNSRHHQAVKAVPAGWVVSATAPDGIIEALELPGHPFALGVQWHPENMQGRPVNYDPLFAAFVEAARRS